MYNNINIIELLKKYNFDIKFVNGIPSVFYLPSLDVYYNENMFDQKWCNISTLTTYTKQQIFNNFDLIKNKFSEIKDDNFNILNLFFSALFITNNNIIISQIHIFIKIYKHINSSANLFDKLEYIDSFNIKHSAIDKINTLTIQNKNNTAIKTFIGCLLSADYKPNNEYLQIIEKLFGNTYKKKII